MPPHGNSTVAKRQAAQQNVKGSEMMTQFLTQGKFGNPVVNTAVVPPAADPLLPIRREREGDNFNNNNNKNDSLLGIENKHAMLPQVPACSRSKLELFLLRRQRASQSFPGGGAANNNPTQNVAIGSSFPGGSADAQKSNATAMPFVAVKSGAPLDRNLRPALVSKPSASDPSSYMPSHNASNIAFSAVSSFNNNFQQSSTPFVLPSAEDIRRFAEERRDGMVKNKLRRENYVNIMEAKIGKAEDRGAALVQLAIGPGSQITYKSHVNTIQKVTGGLSFQHLISYIAEPKLAYSVCNTTMEQKASAWKEHYLRVERKTLDKEQETFLAKCLQGRRILIPDVPKIKGAVNKYKLSQFLAFLAMQLQDNLISKEDHDSLSIGAIFLYSCALRIFQLKALTRNSFTWTLDPDAPSGKVGWVEVPRKGGAGKVMETKVIHPDFVAFVHNYISGVPTSKVHLFNQFGDYFPHAHYSCTQKDLMSSRLDNLMRDKVEAAANFFGWEACTEFHATHVFRHGAAQDAFIKGGIYLVVMRTGHECRKVALSYALSDSERNRYSVANHDRSDKAVKRYAEELVDLAIEKAQLAVKNRDLSVVPRPTVPFVPAERMTADMVIRYCKELETNNIKIAVFDQGSSGAEVSSNPSGHKLEPVEVVRPKNVVLEMPNQETAKHATTPSVVDNFQARFLQKKQVMRRGVLVWEDFPAGIILPDRILHASEADLIRIKLNIRKA